MKQTRELLKKLMMNAGYILKDKKDSPEAFGSWYEEWENNRNILRIMWDGKDSQLIFQSKKNDSNEWEDRSFFTINNDVDGLHNELAFQKVLQELN